MEARRGGKIWLNIRQLRLVIFALVAILILVQFLTAPTHLYYFYAALAVIFIGNAILALPAIRDFTGRASRPGGGGVVGTVKSSITGGDAANELAEVLRSMGVQAKVVDADSAETVDHDVYMGGVFGNVPLKALKLEGRNIDLVEIYRLATRNSYYYAQNYVVKADVRHLAKELKARLMPVSQGTLSPRVADYRWVDEGAGSFLGWKVNKPMFLFGLFFMSLPLYGLITIIFNSQGMVLSNLNIGIPIMLLLIAVGFMMSFGQWMLIKRRRIESKTALARALNGDVELTRMILHAFKDARIGVDANPDYNYVGISGGESGRWTGSSFSIGGQSVLNPDTITLGIRNFPSRDAFEVYDRIAGHVRRIAPEMPSIESTAETGSGTQREWLAQSAPATQSRLPMRRSFRNLSLLERMSGGLFIIGFALAWFAVAFYLAGSYWEAVLPAAPVVVIFVVIGTITCVYGYRKWASEKRQRQASPVSS